MDQPTADQKTQPSGWSVSAQTAGAVIVVSAGILALVALALTAVALTRANGQAVVAIAAAAFGVIGSVVGAYFGVKVGTEGRQQEAAQALTAIRAEAARAQAFAAHVPDGQADQALMHAQQMAEGQPITPSGASE